jgi:hypothetical protein
MRTCLALLFACFLFGAAGSVQAGESGFLSAYEDLPLPTGIVETPGSGLSFDTPAGRIVEAYAGGPGKAAEVRGFYAETLPQLGWVKTGADTYRRDDERLAIDARQQGRQVVVHFTISPE